MANTTKQDLARALRVVDAGQRSAEDLQAGVAFGEVLRGGDELDHVAAEAAAAAIAPTADRLAAHFGRTV
ncbi:hypothetical protein [Streptomyces sp. NPDC051211]|uniref:hypothetical protein n=1 Tax=Streptomyces sp. NPDC051211 TaxID=3154643 RepID=UPI00344BBFBC